MQFGPAFPSDLTVSDYFCGAGGNTIGARAAGMRVRVAGNHWDKAIDVYAANNPDVDCVRRVNLSAVDPRRFPRTDIGIFSPECTTHSPSGGSKHHKEPDLFDPDSQGPLDEATVRSRVTMQDVIRFSEYHLYRIVIVENVVEVLRWVLFPLWLAQMAALGYRHKLVSRNSMFHHPTPQSRDRLYIVFWRRGNRAPQLDYTPSAPCGTCGRDVHAVQCWKPGRTVGKYRRQYEYRCPVCARAVVPYYYAALNAIDFTIPAERVGDRVRALKPRTRERIRFGLEKYGRRALVVNVKQGARDTSRAWPADARELGTVPTWDGYFGLAHPSSFLVNGQGVSGKGMTADPTSRVRGMDDPHFTATASGSPFLVETAQSHAPNRRPRGLDEPLPTMGTQLSSALVALSSFVTTAGSRDSDAHATDAMPTQTGTERFGLVSPFIVGCANTTADASRVRGLDDPLATAHAGGNNFAIVQGAQISLRDSDAMRVADLTRELMTQQKAAQQGVMSPAPYLVSYYGHAQAAGADDPVDTVTTRDRHALAGASAFDVPDVDDCYFRMLEPPEIGAAMAFPGDYRVTGTKRDRVKLYGNAVTPPVMDWLVRQCAASLHPELPHDEA